MTYNGHRNKNHWNVALWIANDEPLYRSALDAIARNKTKDQAAAALFQSIKTARGPNPQTPDGYPFSVSAIRAAMRDM